MNNFINIKNIDLYSLVRDVIRRLWIAVIVGCLGIMATYTYMRDTYVPVYTSSAIYVVTPSQGEGTAKSNSEFANSVIDIFKNVLYSDIMSNRIKRQLGVRHVTEDRNVELIEETNLIKIFVSSHDPMESFMTIKVIMNNYESLSPYLSSGAVFDELKAAQISQTPDNVFAPRTKSLLVGLIAALLTLIFLSFLSLVRKTVKKEAVIEEQLQTTLLGTIYHEEKNRTIKAKVVQRVKSLLITSPIITSKFIEAVNNVRMKLEYKRDRNPEKNVFMVTSVCENEGKSTVALNVALSLVKENKKVIVIDADMRKPAIYKMLDIPKKNITDMIKLLQGKCGLDEVMYHDDSVNMDIIMPTEGHTNTHEFMKSGAMHDLIQKCSSLADYVIVDTPPMSMVSDAEALLDWVDYVMIVVRQDFSYISDVENCINIVENSHAKLLGCVLNDFKVFKFSFNKNPYGYEYENSHFTGEAVKVDVNE